MYAVCERQRLTDTFGISANRVLQRQTDELLAEAQKRFAETGQSQRLFAVFARLHNAGGTPAPQAMKASI